LTTKYAKNTKTIPRNNLAAARAKSPQVLDFGQSPDETDAGW